MSDNSFRSFPKPEKHKKVSKTEIWRTVRDNEITPQFKTWGIEACELKFKGCKNRLFLGYAHTKKRRNITTPEDLRRVVLACSHCHHIVEYMCSQYTGKTMTYYLEEVIRNRENGLQNSLFTIEK